MIQPFSLVSLSLAEEAPQIQDTRCILHPEEGKQ